ncbi:ABC transporter permease [soil metagenome]
MSEQVMSESVLPEPTLSELAMSERASKPFVRLDPPRGWQMINARELWRFRELIFFLTWRDVKVRYKQTLLGVAWAVLQPAMLMLVFIVFLGKMAKVPSADSPLFVYSGLLPWTFFATAITNAGNSVVGSERLVTKIYFPRLAIPIASVCAALVDFAVAMTLMLGLMIWYGSMPGVSILFAPIILGAIMLTALGVGMALAALNVAYRDFRYVIPFMIQFWMFATPSVYMATNGGAGATGGGWVTTLLALNPMTGLIAAFRATCLNLPIPWLQVGVSSACGIIAFFAGCMYFRRMESTFADTI